MRRAPVAAFITGALLMSCTHAPDAAQLTAIDRLIAATDGAALTLNELDRGRYALADSLFAQQADRYAVRFADTLSRAEAQALGSQWTALSRAADLGRDHERALAEAIAAGERLRRLRNDVAAGALQREQAEPLIAREQRLHAEVMAGVHAVMDNYRLLQQAWDRRDTVETMLANAHAR